MNYDKDTVMENQKDRESILADIKDRVMKATAALYRVTELFPHEEPLKWLLRKKTSQILDIFFTPSKPNLYPHVIS